MAAMDVDNPPKSAPKTGFALPWVSLAFADFEMQAFET